MKNITTKLLILILLSNLFINFIIPDKITYATDLKSDSNLKSPSNFECGNEIITVDNSDPEKLSSNVFDANTASELKTNVIKNSTETVNIYRKTSRSPGEEVKKFNIPFHSNEPLGLEVLETTEIDILIEGDNVTGNGRLNFHDVDQLKFASNVPVGELTTVTIPAKSQLFLDVGGIKYSPNYDTDFNFRVTIKLNNNSYKVTPTFDTRENKINSKTLSSTALKAAALDPANGEYGTLLITENSRIYIPLSKYIRNWFDPEATAFLHENTINKFNSYAGLLDSNPDILNRPRKNFVLVSSRNQQGGYMSAGGTMLDTLPQNMHEYLSGGNTDKWGHYHEYAHLYEQGWGYIEYWNNIFANEISREKFGENWTWLYGNNQYAHENSSHTDTFKNYYENGTSGSIHPMYYFLRLRESFDKDYIASVSTYYRNNYVPYGGQDYIAYHAAVNYGVNILPYLELAGYRVTNYKLIREIIKITNRSFIYISDNPNFEKYKNISIPVTTDMIYRGDEQVLSGMSNPNSKIFIKLDHTEYTVDTDNKGKFKFLIPATLTENSDLSVSSKENGKEKSFYKKIIILDNKNELSFRGYENNEFLKVKINFDEMKFEATSNGQVANQFSNSNPYVKFDHYNRRGDLIESYSMGSSQNSLALVEKLNGIKFRDGEYIKLHHSEQGRLSVSGYIKNVPAIINQNSTDINLTTSYFYMKDGKLTYSDKFIEQGINIDDLSDLAKSGNDYLKVDYTKSTFEIFEKNLTEANRIISNYNTNPNSVSLDLIQKCYSSLNKAYTNLKKINILNVKGYNNNLIATINFNTETNKFLATSTGNTANQFVGNGTYFTLNHYNKRNELLATYSMRSNENADELVKSLNNKSFREDDYFTLSHREQNGRLSLSGNIVNLSTDLTNGVGSLDLSKSLFYLTGENLVYSESPLDIPLNTDDLNDYIHKAESLDSDDYTKVSHDNLLQKIAAAKKILTEKNPHESIIKLNIASLETALTDLKKQNSILFKGYNNELIFDLKFDTITNKFIATSTGNVANTYQGSNIYIKVLHYKSNGDLVQSYQIRGNENANNLVNSLNNVSFSEGDYIKFYHREPQRLSIGGYIENSPRDLSIGSSGIDLDSSYFYLYDDNLIYASDTLNQFKNEDVNKDNSIDILDIAKTSSSYNSGSGKLNYFINRDVNKDGFIDIFDLILISKKIQI